MLARGTKEWIRRDDELGTNWALEYIFDTLGRNLAIAGAIEYGHRLGLCEREISYMFDSQPTVRVFRPTPTRSVIYG